MFAIISCGKNKLARPARARELYTGSYFRMQYAYAKHVGCHTIFILSAKYGLVRDTALLEPYEETVRRFSPEQRQSWCRLVADQLTTIGEGKILALVSEAYLCALEPRRSDLVTPTMGMNICRRRHFYSRSLKT